MKQFNLFSKRLPIAKPLCDFDLMELIPIQVEAYAGHKADETPRRFQSSGQPFIEIEEVLDHWYQVESLPEWPCADYFKVRAIDGREYLLKHDQEEDAWFLCRTW